VTSAKPDAKADAKADSKSATDAKSAAKGKPETKSVPAGFGLASASSVPVTLGAAAKPDAKAETKAEPKSAPQVYAVASAGSVPITLTSKSDPGASTTVQVPRWAATNSAPTGRNVPAVGSEDPIHPVMVKTVLVKPGSAVQTASLAPLQLSAAPEPPAPATTQSTAQPSAIAPVKAAVLPFPPPGTRPGAFAGLPSHVTAAPAAEAAPAPIAAAAPPPAPSPAPVAATRNAPAPQIQHTGWIIQVGAFPAEGEAKQRLSAVQSKASKFLASADAFTESVSKGDATLYRARFAGLGKDQAEAACTYLKHNDVDCMTIKN
jgi:D-alanyl-D-alanine carboxypeptidase